MRARRSCPRSSVPKGCAAVGSSRRAVKSMSLIDTLQSAGPNTTASAMMMRMTAPATASRWRRKRRQASSAGETCGARPSLAAPGSAVSNAGVEPAIEEVCDEVKEDDETGEDEGHRHDDRRVVGDDRADQQRAD